MREHLEKLAAHLESLDSESGDAKAIRWALSELDGRTEAAAKIAEKMRIHDAMSGWSAVPTHANEIAAEIRALNS